MNREALLPKNNAEYATKEYWEKRYESDKGVYDWFKGYDNYKHILRQHIHENDKVLHVGCGNSTLGEDLYDDMNGCVDIVNMDFATNVIETMRERNKNIRPSLKWEVMDIFNLPCEDNSFDVVLDKGMMDAIMCEQADVWKVPEPLQQQCDLMFTQISRVLRPGGRYIYITFGQPHFRKPLLLKPDPNDPNICKYRWTLKVETVGDGFHYFVYILTKQTEQPTSSSN